MILYLLKFTLCSATLLLFYKVVLEREKLLRFNRFYLLGSLVLSLVLPLISTEIVLQEVVFPPPASALTASTSAGPQTYPVRLLPEPSAGLDFSWIKLAGVLYVLVSTWLLVRFGRNLLHLTRRIQRFALRNSEGIQLVLLDGPTVPHSFLSYVFVSKAEYSAGMLESEIMAHERAHASQLHSMDILFIEFLKVIFWFNPALSLYRNAIAMNHEFLADAAVIQNSRDVSAYQHLLLQKSCSPVSLPFISKFNYSFIKKRFVMMHKKTSPVRAALAQVSVLPLLAIAFFAFSDLTLAQIVPPPPPVEMAPTSGLSPEKIKEYHALLDKYIRRSGTSMALAQPSQADGNKIIAFQDAMSQAQTDTLTFKVYNPKPTPRQNPTKAEFEKYKNPNVYGVWLDGKKISNTKLSTYKTKDIIQSFVSRVYANAQPKTGYKYKYQVDLMTTQYYDAYIKEALENPSFLIVMRDRFKQ